MKPREHYLNELHKRGYGADPAQEQALALLDEIHAALLVPPARSVGLWTRWRGAAPGAPRGAYLWGDVGRGKTFLLDCFFASLPFAEKRRLHFQRFMEEIHGRLRSLPKVPDPLPIIAAAYARETRVLCLDEFHVDDVADAMLLGGLLHGLVAQGVTMLFTSNLAPQDLYRNGLQRERFLPAIDLIERHAHVFELRGPLDYREVRSNGSLSRYHHPADASARAALEEHFRRAEEGGNRIAGGVLQINDRSIATVAQASRAVWFEFDAICNTPRSAADYLAIATRFPTVVVSDIPALSGEHDDAAQRFIQLIDALYDNGVCLAASAHAAIDVLYRGRGLQQPFARTLSRLREMCQ